MSTDLSRALAELADQAADQAALATPESLAARRRRRRTVRRGTSAVVGLAAVGGLVFAGATLADWRADQPQPAITGPSPSPSTHAVPLPGCGDPAPTTDDAATTVLTVAGPTAGAATDEVPLHLDLTVTGDEVPTVDDLAEAPTRVLLVSADEVVAVGDLPGTPWTGLDADGAGLTVDATLTPCSALPADVQAVVVVRLADRLLVSAPVEVAPSSAADEDRPSGGGGGTGGTTTSLPLPDPMVSRWDGVRSIVSDTPASGDGLADGSYYGDVRAVSAASGTITVDIGIFYGGDAANEWAAANDPAFATDGLFGLAVNGYVVVNDVVRPRTLTLAPDAVVTGYCSTADGILQERITLAELASATDSSPGCLARSYLSQAPSSTNSFWVDIRDGQVAQLVGQYVP